MGIENVTSEGWAWFAVVLLILLNIYNTFSTARKNAREEKKRKEQPTVTLEEKINAYARMLDTDKRRLDGHDKAIGDLQSSQQVLCSGVMALLDHELHNGNSDQMQTARDDIMKFLQGHMGG